MEPDSNHNNQDQKILELEAQLREAAAAENFFETASGRLAVEIATKEIDSLVKDICSDKFLEDHRGYVIAVLKLSSRREWLRKLTAAKHPVRVAKIQERLEQHESQQ